MGKPFTPSFQHLQRDIERLLTSEGKREKNEHGQVVFRGYPDALERMFQSYLEAGALAPLVAELRKWNPEWSYSDYLLTLTSRLREARDWPLLLELWSAVVAKRRTNYNKTREARRSSPVTIPEDLVTKTKDLLIESLQRLEAYAVELGRESDVEKFAAMRERAERRARA